MLICTIYGCFICILFYHLKHSCLYPPVYVCVLNLNSLITVVLCQASELAEHTAKIALLEDAWKRKEEEANTWQLRVRALTECKQHAHYAGAHFLGGISEIYIQGRQIQYTVHTKTRIGLV